MHAWATRICRIVEACRGCVTGNPCSLDVDESSHRRTHYKQLVLPRTITTLKARILRAYFFFFQFVGHHGRVGPCRVPVFSSNRARSRLSAALDETNVVSRTTTRSSLPTITKRRRSPIVPPKRDGEGGDLPFLILQKYLGTSGPSNLNLNAN
jgi:hypothetical protein